MDIQKNSFLSIDQLANQYLNNSRKTVKAAQENLVSFQEILQSKSNEQLKFSKHAAHGAGEPPVHHHPAQRYGEQDCPCGGYLLSSLASTGTYDAPNKGDILLSQKVSRSSGADGT